MFEIAGVVTLVCLSVSALIFAWFLGGFDDA